MQATGNAKGNYRQSGGFSVSSSCEEFGLEDCDLNPSLFLRFWLRGVK